MADQEAWTRKILEFIGLEWDERCLAFREAKRSVVTASAWQVQQKIYRRSVERWRNYEKFIGPLKGLRDYNKSVPLSGKTSMGCRATLCGEAPQSLPSFSR